MPAPFAWFDLRAKDPDAARSFYEKLLDWTTSNVPMGEASLTMIGEGQPWARIAASDTPGWLPYIEVDDLDKAAERAVELGATLDQARTQGPAGSFVTITDPAGATVALWQAAAG